VLDIRDLLKCLIVPLAALVSEGVAQTVSHPVICPVPLTAPYRPQDYDFLRSAVRDHSITQLGESIQLTEEFPRARVRMVRFLHEELGSDVIALEGSAVNAWPAMEALYQSPHDSAATRKAQEIAWFPLWDTDAMYELMAYIAQTQSTRDPLYLESFGMQAGASRGTGDRVFSQLFSAVARVLSCL
jgi:erythromycin esterase-like protein